MQQLAWRSLAFFFLLSTLVACGGSSGDDQAALELTLNGDEKITVEATTDYQELGATATDKQGNDLDVQIEGQVDTQALGTYTLTYMAEDSEGNTISATREITVVDTTAPELTLQGPSNVTLEALTEFTDQGATAEDSFDGELNVTVNGTVNTNAVGTYTITYSATDNSGNLGSIKRTVNVVDTNAPQITLNGESTLIWEAATEFVDPGVSAVDAVEGEPEVTVTGTVNTRAIGTYTLTYIAADSSGNKASVQREVSVVDTTAPQITLTDGSSINWEAATSFADPGYSANDGLDGEINLHVEGTVDTATLGSYILTYSATDSSGNQASVQREVNVVDTTAPKLTLQGKSNVTLEALTEFTDQGATAEDSLDGELDVTLDGTVDINNLGTYILTYSATDSSGNQASIQREVNVVDTTAPVISLNGDINMELPEGRNFIDPGAQAEDAFEGVLLVSITGEVDINTQGQYQLTYSAQDSSGNQAIVQRTVEVREFRPFITTWQTDKPGGETEDNQIRIQTVNSGADFTVDWGDGHVDENLSGTTTHTYDSAGEYQIKIYGNFPYIRHSTSSTSSTAESKKLVSLDQWGDIQWQSMQRAFANAGTMLYKATDVPDLSQVTDMSEMFYGAQAFNGDISQWDVSSVTDMGDMFRGAEAFNGDISQWDVSNVTDMSWMFSNAVVFNGDISQWDVSNVTDMGYMFYLAKAFNSDLSQWDVSNVTNMRAMFFVSSSFNGDISQWDVSNVTNMGYMFAVATAFNGDLSQWDVSNVTDMGHMFRNAEAFNSDLSQWDVSKVTNMTYMFSGAEAFNSDLSQWDVSNVTDMTGMFGRAKVFNGDLSQWDVSSVTSMWWMFNGLTLSTQHYDDLLQSWSTLPLQSGVEFHGGNSQYSAASESARSVLQNTYGWTITDGGLVQP